MNRNILIIGAGPAGLACAAELARARIKFTLVEKDEKVGGLAKTLEFRENDLLFRTDIGPHRFFSKNKYLYEFIEGLLREKWKLVSRHTRQFIEGKFYDYPVNAFQAFKNIGPIKAIKIGLDYISAIISYRLLKKKVVSFEDYIVANFGRTLGEFNMLNYTEKIWGVACSSLHPDWAKQRIKGLDLLSALRGAILKSSSGPRTLVDHFYYPQYGTGLIYETIAEKIVKKGNRICTSSHPTKIRHHNKTVTEVEMEVNGKKETIKPDILVESIPITEFVSLLSPRPPPEVVNAAKKLRWRAQVYLFLTLDKPRITKDNWIYFPDKEIPFGRVSEMKNFSPEMSPKGKTSLFVEFFVFENDRIWNMTKEEVFELAIGRFEELGFFRRKDVRNYYLLKRKNVYPVYDLRYQKNLKMVKDYLNGFKNLFYIGRPGRFTYTNQDHSLEMGIVTAKSIVEKKRYDLERIGAEKEYFEKGDIKT